MPCLAPTLFMFNVRVMISAILVRQTGMRAECAPQPPLSFGPVLGALVDAFGVFAAGPAGRRPRRRGGPAPAGRF